jgi:hypothetical protein
MYGDQLTTPPHSLLLILPVGLFAANVLLLLLLPMLLLLLLLLLHQTDSQSVRQACTATTAAAGVVGRAALVSQAGTRWHNCTYTIIAAM